MAKIEKLEAAPQFKDLKDRLQHFSQRLLEGDFIDEDGTKRLYVKVSGKDAVVLEEFSDGEWDDAYIKDIDVGKVRPNWGSVSRLIMIGVPFKVKLPAKKYVVVKRAEGTKYYSDKVMLEKEQWVLKQHGSLQVQPDSRRSLLVASAARVLAHVVENGQENGEKMVLVGPVERKDGDLYFIGGCELLGFVIDDGDDSFEKYPFTCDGRGSFYWGPDSEGHDTVNVHQKPLRKGSYFTRSSTYLNETEEYTYRIIDVTEM